MLSRKNKNCLWIYLEIQKLVYIFNCMIEIFGYLASLVTVASFLMKDVRGLRIVNLIACIMFVIYGVLISSYPIAAVNLIVALITIA